MIVILEIIEQAIQSPKIFTNDEQAETFFNSLCYENKAQIIHQDDFCIIATDDDHSGKTDIYEVQLHRDIKPNKV
jgi:hypothetical protein